MMMWYTDYAGYDAQPPSNGLSDREREILQREEELRKMTVSVLTFSLGNAAAY